MQWKACKTWEGINMKKIREIYSCDKLEGDDPLVIWHNDVIEKYPDELAISDVARCIRQKLFLDVAYKKLLEFLLQSPYAGDLYAGELLEKACEMGDEYIEKYRETLVEIIKSADEFARVHEWEIEEDKRDYLSALDNLKGKLSEVESGEYNSEESDLERSQVEKFLKIRTWEEFDRRRDEFKGLKPSKETTPHFVELLSNREFFAPEDKHTDVKLT